MSETPDAPAADTGPLSIDAAISLIQGAETAPETDDTPPDDGADTQPPESDTPSEAGAQPDEDPDAAAEPISEDGDEADAAEAEETLPIIDPPQFWAADDKAAFAELPRHLQEKVVEHEKNRERAATTAIERAVHAQRQAEGQAAGATELKGRLDKLLPDAEQIFTSRWAGVDLLEIAKAYGADKAEEVKAQYDAEVASLTAIKKAATDANDAALRVHRTNLIPALKAAIPELDDPVRGQELAGKLDTYLKAEGYTDQSLQWAEARDFRLAYESMLWREHVAAQSAAASAAKTALAPKPKPTPVATRPSPTVKPTAAPVLAPPQKRVVEQSRNRFAQTRSMKDAAALIEAMSKG